MKEPAPGFHSPRSKKKKGGREGLTSQGTWRMRFLLLPNASIQNSQNLEGCKTLKSIDR